MASPLTETSSALADAIDAVEGTYEFMLAYAAQGRRTEEEGDSGGIRAWLTRASAACDTLASLKVEDFGALGTADREAYSGFVDVFRDDGKKARAAIRFVLAQRSISSQIIDNLNASNHIRTLLTDIFLLDEATKISGI